jgi:hypothetical protein
MTVSDAQCWPKNLAHLMQPLVRCCGPTSLQTARYYLKYLYKISPSIVSPSFPLRSSASEGDGNMPESTDVSGLVIATHYWVGNVAAGG